MEALDKKYLSELEAIKTKIQASENLEKYLDEEEDDDYKALAAEIEPEIQELYLRVANDNPLQLESFEKELLDDGYEGLYLPKVVGYSVLRGAVDANVKYRHPQDHFREILIDIANSANFEMIKQRIGQSVQIGFALSSDIWITNLVESISNKRVRGFLESQKSDHLRVAANRAIAFNLDTDSYAEYFQITKTFILYVNIFSNQKFNQDVKDLSLRYIKRLIKTYTDKRGRDYQDIKKFVKSTFLDLNFMTDKQLVELFKTKRKKKEA